MSYQLTGTLLHKSDTQQVSATFSKREFVVETIEEKYPQQIKFELKNDKTPLLDTMAQGQKITVHFNISGREWNGKYFVNLHAWKIESDAAPVQTAPIETVEVEILDSQGDGLPF